MVSAEMQTLHKQRLELPAHVHAQTCWGASAPSYEQAVWETLRLSRRAQSQWPRPQPPPASAAL